MTDLPVRPDLVDPASVGAFTEDEASYARASRASSTLRGYRSDWREFTSWCDQQGDLPSLPASAAAVSGYLAALAGTGAKVGTMSRRLSAIRFVHQLRDQPDPTRNARVTAVWEGIRRTHGAPPEQSAPLMPAGPIRRRRRLADHQGLAHPRTVRPSLTSPAPGTGLCSSSASSRPCAAASSLP